MTNPVIARENNSNFMIHLDPMKFLQLLSLIVSIQQQGNSKLRNSLDILARIFMLKLSINSTMLLNSLPAKKVIK